MMRRLRLSVLALVPAIAAGPAVLSCGSFSADGGGADAGTGADVGADAACSAARYCACQSAAAFCADFDGPAVVAEWDQKTEAGGGAISAIASDRSAPSALQTVTPAVASAIALNASVTKRIQGDVAKLSLAFDLADTADCAVGVDSVTYVDVAALDSSGAAAGNTSLLATKSGVKVFVKGGPNESTDLQPLPNTRRWTRVAFAVSSGMLVVTFDGEPAAPPIPFPLSGASFDLRLGVTAMAGSSMCTASYDDVVVRLAP
jgi:hypothetical protein